MRTRTTDISGFSLIEVMIAMTILAVGILVIAQMQVAAINGLAYSRRMSSATQLAQHQLEYLRTMPFGTNEQDAAYNGAGENIFTDPTLGDGNFSDWHYYGTPVNAEGNPVSHTGGGNKYYVRWHVERGPMSPNAVRGTGGVEYPGPGQMVIEVEVFWFKGEGDHTDLMNSEISGDQLRNEGGSRVQIRGSRSVNF